MSKMNLRKMTMAFAAPAAQPAPDAVAEVKNIVTKQVNKMVKPVAPKATKAKAQRDPNSLLTNNFRKFSVVGTTNFKGSQKIWFANETAVKVKNMIKQGHADVNYITLPQPMTKSEVLDYLKANPTLLPQELVDEKSNRLTTALKGQAHKG